MDVDSVLALLSRFAKYPVVALIAVVVGVVSYDATGDLVRSIGFSLIFIGFPLLLLSFIDAGMYGFSEYLGKRMVDSSVVLALGFICIYISEPRDLRGAVGMFIVIAVAWALIRKAVERKFRESDFVVIDFSK